MDQSDRRPFFERWVLLEVALVVGGLTAYLMGMDTISFTVGMIVGAAMMIFVIALTER